jgi:citrate synthase
VTDSASEWTTAIAEVRDDDVLIRGYLLGDLIGRATYSEMAFLVLTGSWPEAGQRQMLDALFVALAEHGISPSSIIVRSLASCGSPLQGALAGAANSIAEYHGGAGETLARVLTEIVHEVGDDEDRILDRAKSLVQSYRTERRPLEGFGHPQHGSGDPRAIRLLELATEYGVAGPHVTVLKALGRALDESSGRKVPVNVNGALAAIAMDLGFSWRAVRGLVIAPRMIGLTAHYTEEIEAGSRWRHASSDRVSYTGQALRPFER